MNHPELSCITRLVAGAELELDQANTAMGAARAGPEQTQAALRTQEAARTDAEAARVDTEAKLAQMQTRLDAVEADRKADILSVNDKFLEVSKSSKHALAGHGHNTTRHPGRPKEVFKQMWRTIGRGDIFRGMVKNRAKDGTPCYVDAVIAPILGENGKPMKYLGVRYDITEAEIERQNARGILARAVQAHHQDRARHLDPGGVRAGQGRDGPCLQGGEDRHRRDHPGGRLPHAPAGGGAGAAGDHRRQAVGGLLPPGQRARGTCQHTGARAQ